MRLEKGMYGYPKNSKLFGLREGSCVAYDFVHNGGWYNCRGEKLGWGDLSLGDIRKISEELEEGEFFIILYESDSFWKHVEKISGPASLGMVKIDKEAEMDPGLEHVIEKAPYAITKGKVYVLPGKYDTAEDSELGPTELGYFRSGESLDAELITREMLREMLLK